MLEVLASASTDADRDERVCVVVLTGGEKLFAAGADLDELAGLRRSNELENPRFQACAAVQSFSKRLIAAVKGW